MEVTWETLAAESAIRARGVGQDEFPEQAGRQSLAALQKFLSIDRFGIIQVFAEALEFVQRPSHERRIEDNEDQIFIQVNILQTAVGPVQKGVDQPEDDVG